MDSSKQIQNISVDLIIPNRFQPRLTFDENALNELSKSIKEHGIIQPLVLRKINDKYEIIAGERRYKAAIIAGLTEVPAIITNIGDNESAEVALVENVQRKNLNSMEEAKSYKKLLDRGYLTQDSLAKKLGVSQSTIANKLRLLNLTPEVQEALMNNRISERHARSLLLVNDKFRQISLLNRVIAERLTVRQLDDLIKDENNITGSNVDGGEVLTKQTETTLIGSHVGFSNFEQNQAFSNEVNMFDVSSNNLSEPLHLEKENSENIANTESQNMFDIQDSFNIFDNSTEGVDNNTSEDLSIERVVDNQETVSNDESLNTENIINDTLVESIDTLDSLDDNKSSINNFLNIFNTSNYSSLEDEVTNMSTGSDDYFNPFSNMNDTESDVATPKEEIKTEVVAPVEIEKRIKENDLDSVKKAYLDLKKEVAAAGFKISTEDFDFEDIYQIIIKIDKQD